jgi:hypothetical protein
MENCYNIYEDLKMKFKKLAFVAYMCKQGGFS